MSITEESFDYSLIGLKNFLIPEGHPGELLLYFFFPLCSVFILSLFLGIMLFIIVWSRVEHVSGLGVSPVEGFLLRFIVYHTFDE